MPAPWWSPELLTVDHRQRLAGTAGSPHLLSARPLAVAALLGFLVSRSQYGTSLAVGGGRLTLPMVLLPFVDRGPQVAATLSLVFLVPPLLALAAVGAVWRRSGPGVWQTTAGT